MTAEVPEMVERVARAICQSECDNRLGPGKCKGCSQVWRESWIINQARAAIEAMREPTEAMASEIGRHDTVSIWKAMIDAALAKHGT